MALTVGMVGLGIMGSAISGTLLSRGFRVVGFDIDQTRLDEFAARGGEPEKSAASVAAAADAVILLLPTVAALEDVVAGENGVAAWAGAEAHKDLVVIESGTFPIENKEWARDTLAASGVTLLDCPLSGTGAQAATGDLVVYASGDEDAYARCGPVFDGFARSHFHLGAFGNGSRMKFVANHLVAIHNVATAEALVLGMKAGLDAGTIHKVISDGAGSSRMFELRGAMMVEDRYQPAGMKSDVWQKDMSIIGAFAAGLGCPVPLFAATAPLYSAALAQGHGADDTASVCAVLEEMARLERPKR
jgi:3-hydroxyisobutyrate dehydrogenase-like beta-hydroxyacid dehydrogenase